MKATFIKKLDGFKGDARLFSVEPPMKGYGDEEFSFVVVSAVIVMYSGPETYIFGADGEGEILNWGELDGSYRGGLDHQKALEGAGCTVDMTPAQIIDLKPTPKRHYSRK